MGNNIPCLEQVKNQTLSSSTSPYRPYKGVTPGAKSIIVQSTKRALKVEKNDLLRAPIEFKARSPGAGGGGYFLEVG